MAEENMSKGKVRQVIEGYVNEVCSAFLEPHSEFVSIAYRSKASDEAYVRVMTAADEVRYFNITGMAAQEVCEMVVKMVAGEHIQREITDKSIRKDIAPLFR